MDSTTTTTQNTIISPREPVTNSDSGIFSIKNILIVILVLLLVFSFLGINLLNLSGGFLQSLSNSGGPVVKHILTALGYSTGQLIDTTTDVAVDTAKVGVDIAGGSLHSVGQILKGSGNNSDLDSTINESGILPNQAQPDSSESPIQNNIQNNKAAWCLVGDYQGRRGCVSVTDTNKCLSGQLFPDRQTCLNPNLSNNMNYFNALKGVQE
jgi:hypothetical protein